jgi:hypothetical protein
MSNSPIGIRAVSAIPRTRAAILSLALVAGVGCHQVDYSPRYDEGEIGIFDIGRRGGVLR